MAGGLALAGAAGLSAALAPRAVAADGDNTILGSSNDATSATRITIGGASGSTDPALQLTNRAGPALRLDPVDEDAVPPLRVGEIANTPRGPLIGVEIGNNVVTTPLLTEQDVWLPFSLPTPMRLVDTRYADGRSRLTQPSPLDGLGRLPARRSLTFWIAPTGLEFAIQAVFLNITVVNPAAAGYVTVYPGPRRPGTSTVNVDKGRTVANGTLVGTSIGTYSVLFDPSQPPQQVSASVITVYTSVTAALVIDATAAFATGAIPPLDDEDSSRRRSTTSPVEMARRRFGRLR